MYRSEKYLAYVRRKPCCACLKPAPSHAHHFGPHGTATKPSDYRAVPLCDVCHYEWHAKATLPDIPEPREFMRMRQLELMERFLHTMERRDGKKKEPVKGGEGQYGSEGAPYDEADEEWIDTSC